MNAEVVIINQTKGMIAALSEVGDYIILEIMGNYDIDEGDIVSHTDFYSMGSEEYYNLSKQYSFSVYVQNVCGNLYQAKKQCFL